jgi:hypothetical protein
MELKNFTVVYYPFVSSDVTATIPMTGKDEDDVLKQFRAEHQVGRVKSITED